MNQIYEAAAAGHLDQAQQMITQVLADHPTSAKAHYVQAELYAKEGKNALARAELGTAERLNPGLTEFKLPFRARIEIAARLEQPLDGGHPRSCRLRRAPTPHFPWGRC